MDIQDLKTFGLSKIALALLFLGCMGLETPNGVFSEDKASVVNSAKKDLAQRLGVKEQTIELVGQVEEITWPDASLGCPEPGKMYALVLTPGHKLTLRSGGKLYEYHAGKGVVKLCKQ